MIVQRKSGWRRGGTAAVECGVVLTFVMVPLMIGIWEIGRLVFCQQVVVTACREGARLAAQGRTVNSSGSPTEIRIASGTPNVKETVYFALETGGLPGLGRSYVMGRTQFRFMAPYVKASPYDPDPTEPFEAQKGQRFQVSLSLEWSKLRWINLGILSPTEVFYQVEWAVLVDDPFDITTQLPLWDMTSP